MSDLNTVPPGGVKVRRIKLWFSSLPHECRDFVHITGRSVNVDYRLTCLPVEFSNQGVFLIIPELPYSFLASVPTCLKTVAGLKFRRRIHFQKSMTRSHIKNIIFGLF